MQEIQYRIEYTSKAALQLDDLDQQVRTNILKNIGKKLQSHPYEFGKPLQHQWKNHFRLRVGSYRVIYQIRDETVTVLIVEVDHRKDAYS